MEKETICFTSNPDFELRFTKNRTCKYDIYNSAFKDGLLVYIPGFGGDLGDYTEVFCKKAAEKYKLATMSVEYFCINARPSVGAEIELEESDLRKMQSYVPVSDEGISFTKAIIEYAEVNKKHLKLSATLKPKRGEYQNFGILAALDILNAIKNAVDKYSIDVNNIILIGSSYGGYLANLVTKIFPGFIRAVFDNSSWANPRLNYIVGRELNEPEFSMLLSAYVTMSCFVKTPWTLSAGLPHSFDIDKMAIRSFSSDQVSQMAAQGGLETFYYFYHSDRDTIAPTQEKIEMIQSMVSNGFKHISLYVADDSDIDGIFIKTLDHGMGMSMLMFFDLAYQSLIENHIVFNSSKAGVYTYHSEKCDYCFDVTQSPISASINYYD